MAKKSAGRLSVRTKSLLAVAAGVEIALVGIAHADLSRRNDDSVRGSKGMWRAITLITYVGPVWYFLRGRR